MAEQYNLNAPTDQANLNYKNLQGIFAGQRGETADFLGRYTGAINGQESTSAMADRIGNELNLPTLRANANQINTTLANLPSTYSKATTGYDVNANQLARVIGQKSSDLAPAATTANNAVNAAEGNLTTRLGYGQADEAKALLPFQSEQSLLSDRMARETTGYSSAMQGELDAIISKMNAGITLSEGEKNRAQQLAVAEQQYQNTLKLNQDSRNNSSTPPDYKTLTAGDTLIDPSTGRVIASIPKSSGGSSSTSTNYYGSTPSKYSLIP